MAIVATNQRVAIWGSDWEQTWNLASILCQRVTLIHPFIFAAKPCSKTPPREEQRASVITHEKPVPDVLTIQRQSNQHIHPPKEPWVQEEGVWAILHHNSFEHTQPNGPFSWRPPDGGNQHPSAHQLYQPLCVYSAWGQGRLPCQLCRTGRNKSIGTLLIGKRTSPCHKHCWMLSTRQAPKMHEC